MFLCMTVIKSFKFAAQCDVTWTKSLIGAFRNMHKKRTFVFISGEFSELNHHAHDPYWHYWQSGCLAVGTMSLYGFVVLFRVF